MATIYGTTGNDSLYGTTDSDSIYTGMGRDWVVGSGGSDFYSLGYKSSIAYLRYGFTDYDMVSYRDAWQGMALATSTTMYIVADLQLGTVTKFEGSSVLGTDTLVGADAVHGTDANDTLRGRDFWHYEEFHGNGGNDLIDGRGGEDWVNYQISTAGISVDLAAGTVTSTDPAVGTDTLREIEGVVGTMSDDTYVAIGHDGTSANRNSFGGEWNMFAPLGGNDTVTGNGQTALQLGSYAAALTVDLSLQTSLGTSANIVSFTPMDSTTGIAPGSLLASGVNFVVGGAYADLLIGGGRVNTAGATLATSESDDLSFERFRGQGGDDTIRGGTGFDRADYRQGSLTEGIEVNLALGRVVGDALLVGRDTLRGTESVLGTYLDDVYDARGFTLASAASASANSGDILAVVPEGVTLTSRAFNEFIASGGNDLVTGNGATRVTIDHSIEKIAGVSSRVVFTGQQAGYADYGLTEGGLGHVDFTATYAVRGGIGNDEMTGTAGYQQLQGHFGNDTLRGADGDDILYGYTGGDKNALNLSTTSTDNDSLDGGAGNDLLRGDFGNDVLQGGTGADTMEGGTGNDTYRVDNLRDVVTELARGGTDTVYSAVANYTLGTQVETGRISIAGVANLTGNALANTLVGGAGANRLTGAGGKDTLTGGGGNDVFDFNLATDSGTTSATWDVVTDFTAGDRIDLAGIDADTATAEDDAFSGTLVTAFTAAGQLRFDAATGVLYGNTDADGAAEFAIQLTGVASLGAAALVL